ncbi:MAG: hypothetical protein HQK89_06360 [Nitrospirae bacterium]|nr:hypothetical protein [Nitrospirota bacterium]
MDETDFLEEEWKMGRLRSIVDRTRVILASFPIRVADAYDLIEETRKEVLVLFPDKEEVYDLIYAPRFERDIRERFKMN